MTITNDDLLLLLTGAKVIISDCKANEHGLHDGCLCHLKGTVQTIGKRYGSGFIGQPSWHLDGHTQRVLLSEITLVREGGAA